MKIRRVTAHPLVAPLPEPFAFSQGWVRRRSATIVEIETDDGNVGWGEAFAQGLEPPQIAAAVVEHALAPLLLGKDAFATEVLWHRMYHATRDYGRTGTVVAAISAVDIALWDLVGKAHGQPVHRLLGGAFRSAIRAYATGFYRKEEGDETARLVQEALDRAAAGFAAIKVKVGFGVAADIGVLRAIAGALKGSGVQMLMDANHAYGVAEAIALGRAVADLSIGWFEEPVAPEDRAGYAEVRRAVPMPIAGGENEHTAYGFRDFIAARGVDVLQPDLASCGGFTAARSIVALAQANGLRVNPHVWGTGVAQAASVQLIAALPVPHHARNPVEPMLEYDCSDHPFRMALVSHPTLCEQGVVSVPSRPGIGVDVDRAVLRQYRAPA
ncbi:MAG: mandelate racemase/muconate lactonizing enzyme family protein [Betaproteobacteria bacterium]